MSDTFRKTGPESSLDMFQAEADGLAELRAAGEVRVPEVIDCGVSNGSSFIVLERLRLESASRKVEQRFSSTGKSPVVWRNLPPARVYYAYK